MSDEGKGVLRTASIDDAAAITAFLAEIGLVMPEGPEAVARHWHGLWVDNPALIHHRDAGAPGWILEDGGAIKGFFGNVPLVYWLGERPVTISCASTWAVMPEYRAETSRLCDAYFNQGNVDLLLVSSAIPPVGKRFREYGGMPMPQPDYGDILYWIIDAPGFLRAGLRKKGRSRFAAFWLALFGSVPLDFSMRLGGRRPFAALDQITPVGIQAVDGAFDDLWQRRRRQLPETLLASRDAATLKWHFGLGAGSDEARVLRYDRDGVLKGYAVLVREDAPAIGLKRMKIADLFIDDDDPKVMQALLAGAYEYAMARGCHVLELIGLSATLRAQALENKPYTRQMATFPFFYKALTAEMTTTLASPAAWYVTAYDGDTSLI
ncbi:MAG: hypothetical protein WD075_15005 [Rhodospirillales bacterium]